MRRGKQTQMRAQRVLLWHAQGGKCHCCDRPMWERRVEKSGEFRFRVFGSPDVGPTRHDLQSFWLCTFEHVVPREKGARRDSFEGDVATCRECNCLRARHDYWRFRELVRGGLKPAEAAAMLREVAA